MRGIKTPDRLRKLNARTAARTSITIGAVRYKSSSSNRVIATAKCGEPVYHTSSAPLFSATIAPIASSSIRRDKASAWGSIETMIAEVVPSRDRSVPLYIESERKLCRIFSTTAASSCSSGAAAGIMDTPSLVISGTGAFVIDTTRRTPGNASTRFVIILIVSNTSGTNKLSALTEIMKFSSLPKIRRVWW